MLSRVGYRITTHAVHTDGRFAARLRRRLANRPYQDLVPPATVGDIVRLCGQNKATTIFLNVVNFTPLAEHLKQAMPEIRIVLLSHGLESVDYLHTIRSRELAAPFAGVTKYDELRLARQLIAECHHRQWIDDVLCLSPFEVEIERWLGAKRVEWLPRIVKFAPIPWQPVEQRVGFVGRLDHPPNLEGLILVLRELQKLPSRIRVRVVGGATSPPERIFRQFPFVQYLGELTDNHLELEASTWSCFLHPIFCYARGASTKLAVALGWGLPILTTPPGIRGYLWRSGKLLVVDSPQSYANELVQLLTDSARLQAVRAEVEKVATNSPSLESVAKRAHQFLLGCES